MVVTACWKQQNDADDEVVRERNGKEDATNKQTSTLSNPATPSRLYPP